MLLRLFFLISLLLGNSISRGQVLSNQQIAELQMQEIMDSLFLQLEGKDHICSLQSSGLGNEKGAFLLNNFVSYNHAKNRAVALDSAERILVFENFELQIQYLEQSLKLAGFSSIMIRRSTLSVQGYIIDNLSKRAGAPFSFERSYQDEIEAGMIEEIEQSAYSFFKGKMVSAIFWTKYIEPTLVVFSVAGLIYLFFTMRY